VAAVAADDEVVESVLRRLAAAWGQTPWQLLGGLMNVAWLLLEGLRRDAWATSWFDAQAASRLRVSFSSPSTARSRLALSGLRVST
jgi:hypothetical protein